MTSPEPADGIPPLVALADVPAGISQDALDAAIAAVRGYCGWHVAPSIDSTFARRPGTRVLLLPSLHVTAVASVTEDGTAVDSSVWDEDLVESGMLKRLYGIWCGRVAVEFTHGFDVCPDDVRGVVASMASAGVTGTAGQTVGPFSLLASSASAGSFVVSQAHMATLNRYRIPAQP